MKQLAENRQYRAIEIQVARQCAPVLTGIKPSNLLILSQADADRIDGLLSGTGVYYEMFCSEGKQWIGLVYRREYLNSILRKKEYRDFLRSYGYQNFDLSDVILHLKERFVTYKQEKEEFPHEMGLLLGYPLADVKGFIDNEGKNFICSGYWKVYENEEETKQLFNLYTRIREQMIWEIERGRTLWQIVMQYERRIPYLSFVQG